MIILGIDPGFDRIGAAVVTEQNRKEIILHSECIVTDRKQDFSERLVAMGTQIESIIAAWNPTALAIEKLFFQTNKKTAMQVSEARGVILYIAKKHNLTIFEIGPGTIKLSITGNGRADKGDIIKMIQLTTSLKQAKYDDEYDAVATAITGFHIARNTLPQTKK